MPKKPIIDWLEIFMSHFMTTQAYKFFQLEIDFFELSSAASNTNMPVLTHIKNIRFEKDLVRIFQPFPRFCCASSVCWKLVPFTASFFILICSISFIWTIFVQKIDVLKSGQWLDSNSCPEASVTSALSTVLWPLIPLFYLALWTTRRNEWLATPFGVIEQTQYWAKKY